MTTPVTLLDLPGETATRAAGALHVLRGSERSPLPLARVAIRARVASRIADVTVSQTFQNPFTDPLEAVYVFPLPGGAAVSRFELRVKDRVVRGIAAERQEARRRYQEALDAGKRAALLEEERDDVFTVQVGNLPPGEEVTVTLAYAERLPCTAELTCELRLPLVVAPRYIAGAALGRPPVGDGTSVDSDTVPDASRITPPLLAPGFDPRTALTIEVELAGDVADLACSQHATRTATAPGASRISLARDGERLNRDFVLRYRLGGAGVDGTFVVHRTAGLEVDAYGVVTLLAPSTGTVPARPRDVVFVLDRSGSMGGPKMASAARACALLLRTLGPADRFAIQAFDDRVEWLGGDGAFFHADEAGIARGETYLRSVDARGGTELARALEAALENATGRGAPGRLAVVVLLTDGQVGDEAGAFRRIQQKARDARVFTVGIDTAVNEGFLKRVAALGRGTATFVEPGARLEEALQGVSREIGAPLVFDLAVEGDGVVPGSLTPSRPPDLFAGRGVDIAFRLRGEGSVRVVGRRADGSVFESLLSPRHVDVPAIATLWARARVVDLEDRFRMEPQNATTLRQEIVDVALRHDLVTRFTAFVAVDDAETVADPSHRRKVVQPVETPESWAMTGSVHPAAPLPPRMAFEVSDAARALPSGYVPRRPASLAKAVPSAISEALLDIPRRLRRDPAPTPAGPVPTPAPVPGTMPPPDDPVRLLGDLARLGRSLAAGLARSEAVDLAPVRKVAEGLLPLARTLAATHARWARLLPALEALLAAFGSGTPPALAASLDAFLKALELDFPGLVPAPPKPFWEETV